MNHRGYNSSYNRTRSYGNDMPREMNRDSRETSCENCESREVNREISRENRESMERRDRNYDAGDREHVHEITGSTEVVGECQDCHNHRFCTVSSKPIRSGDSHVHEVKFHTDFSDGHCHDFCGHTSTAIYVGNGKHVHFAYESTESSDGHIHRFQAASLIESPTDFECEA